jgi:hypothetical protein
MSLGTIASTLKGGLNWGVSAGANAAAKRDGVENAATSLRTEWGYGDGTAKEQLFDILFGGTRMMRGDSEAEAEAQTVIDELTGKRTVILNGYKDDMALADQLLMGVKLQHEAYRDGYEPGMIDAKGML